MTGRRNDFALRASFDPQTRVQASRDKSAGRAVTVQAT